MNVFMSLHRELSGSGFYVQLEQLCEKHLCVFVNACHLKCGIQSSGTRDPRIYRGVSVKAHKNGEFSS